MRMFKYAGALHSYFSFNFDSESEKKSLHFMWSRQDQADERMYEWILKMNEIAG